MRDSDDDDASGRAFSAVTVCARVSLDAIRFHDRDSIFLSREREARDFFPKRTEERERERAFGRPRGCEKKSWASLRIADEEDLFRGGSGFPYRGRGGEESCGILFRKISGKHSRLSARGSFLRQED